MLTVVNLVDDSTTSPDVKEAVVAHVEGSEVSRVNSASASTDVEQVVAVKANRRHIALLCGKDFNPTNLLFFSKLLNLRSCGKNREKRTTPVLDQIISPWEAG
jgi:hypothetical protein